MVSVERKLSARHHHDALAEKGRKSLFQQFDSDGSGSIDKPEFDKLYDMIRTHVEDELNERSGLMTRISRSRRRTIALVFLAVVLLSFLCLSVAANAGIIFWIVNTVVTTSSGSEGILLDKDTGLPAQTTVSYDTINDLDDLLDLEPLEISKLDAITIALPDGGQEQYKLDGYSKSISNSSNASVLTLYTSRGEQIRVSTNSVEVLADNGRRRLQISLPSPMFNANGVIQAQLPTSPRRDKKRGRNRMRDSSKPDGATPEPDCIALPEASPTTFGGVDASKVKQYMENWLPMYRDVGSIGECSSVRGTGSCQTEPMFPYTKNRFCTYGLDILKGQGFKGIEVGNQAYCDCLWSEVGFDSIDVGITFEMAQEALVTYLNQCIATGFEPSGDFDCCVDKLEARDIITIDSSITVGGRQLTHYNGHGGGDSCHPAASTLIRCDGSSVRIDAATVGDSIRTPSGCEPITGLFHADADAIGTYHKLTTKGGAKVAISDGHWLFVNGVEADPATVKPGDLLTTATGKQEAVVRVETTTEKGAYHILVASGAYYVDGVAASTYIAHVPLGVWKVFADGYASLRYKLGMPIAPEGEGLISITWPLTVYTALGVPDAHVGKLWPLTTAAAVATELVNVVLAGAASKTAAALILATSAVAMKRMCKIA